ncbi:DUF6082 family protein [Streptomyces sp. NPDC059467]|uniref:DUF6082 family protein n=1 Tax=Streptomyces sp. NPDC059467 TaxID=3346844 RepID=UPI0036B4F66E
MATQRARNQGLSTSAAVVALSAAGAAVSFLAYRRALRALVRANAETMRRLDAYEEERRQTAQRADRIEYQRDHRQLLLAAMEDPELLPVLDAFEGELPPQVQKQYLFANALYVHALNGYRLGLLSRAELIGHVRGIFQSPAARAYWDATRHHRASLPAASDEAEFGRLIDELLAELDENDSDDWWVVGEDPGE